MLGSQKSCLINLPPPPNMAFHLWNKYHFGTEGLQGYQKSEKTTAYLAVDFYLFIFIIIIIIIIIVRESKIDMYKPYLSNRHLKRFYVSGIK